MVMSEEQATDKIAKLHVQKLREQRYYGCIDLPTFEKSMKRRLPLSKDQAILLELYKEICTSWRELVEVRFKLLTLLPAVSAVILITLFTAGANISPIIQTGIALFGLFVTIGLSVYDKRNSELHDDLISRARKIESELGIGTGQFLGRLVSSKKMSLFPLAASNFKLQWDKGGKCKIQLPKKSSAHLLLCSLGKGTPVQLPEDSTLQLPEDSILQLPNNSSVRLPDNSIVQLSNNPRLLLPKDFKLQLLEDSALQLSEEYSRQSFEQSNLKLPQEFPWRKLKLTLSFSNSHISSVELGTLALKLSANSRVRLLGEPVSSEQNLSLPNESLLQLPDPRLLKIPIQHDLGTQFIYRTNIIGWLAAIAVIWLIVLVPILLKWLIPILHK